MVKSRLRSSATKTTRRLLPYGRSRKRFTRGVGSPRALSTIRQVLRSTVACFPSPSPPGRRRARTLSSVAFLERCVRLWSCPQFLWEHHLLCVVHVRLLLHVRVCVRALAGDPPSPCSAWPRFFTPSANLPFTSSHTTSLPSSPRPLPHSPGAGHLHVRVWRL